jgi:hypothetical protein
MNAPKLMLVTLLVGQVACVPDLESLSEGLPSAACGYSPVESGIAAVPKGECWRVLTVRPDARVRLEGETCSKARQCLVASEGETVVPLAASMPPLEDANAAFETVAWPCDELASACWNDP